MSEENAEIARRFLAALGRVDYDDAIDCLHTDVVWVNTESFPDARTITGPRAVIDFWKTLLESFETRPDDGLEIESITATGNRVVAAVRSRAHGVGSGIPVDVHWALGLSMRGDLIERVEISGDYSSALEAAGLS